MARSPRRGPPRVDEANQCIWWGAERVDLPTKAFLVLRRLMGRANQIVTKNELLDAAWPDVHVMEGVLKVAINQLREALRDDAQQPRFIETVHRRGYRWIGTIEGPEAGRDVPPTPRPALPPRPDSPSPLFVGRQSALTQLQQALERAAVGSRQIVFVTGDPGIGKTGLLDEFTRGLHEREVGAVLVAAGECVDGYGTSDAYLPLLQALARLCRSSSSGEVVGRLRRLAPTWLVQLPQLLDAAELDELRRSLAGSSNERMIYELLCFADDLTADHTLLLVLEDLHWSDHATVGALAALANRREPARLMMAASYRPTDAIAQLHPITRLKHELTSKRQCREIALGGLGVDGVDAYLGGRFGSHRLPVELPALMQEQTAGNPLFMLNAVDDWVQRGWLAERGGNWECTVDLATLAGAVPEGTREMIRFRVQQLPAPDLDLLEAASVIGAEFATQALAVALGREPAAVEADCTRLARAAHFLGDGRHARWPDGSSGVQHTFRHALYRQVLYAGVTPARRQLLHRRVADCLETGFGEEADTIAPQLAHHFEIGGDLRRAVRYRRRAARQAMNRFAYHQAIEHLHAGLDMVARLPLSAERDALELALQAVLLTPVYAAVGSNSSAMARVIERIHALSTGGGAMTPELFGALATMVSTHATGGDMRAARSISEQLVARAVGDTAATIAVGILGFCQLMQGEIAAGTQHLERSSGLPELPGPLDPGIAATADAALGRCLLGDPSRALDHISMATRRAAASQRLATITHVAFTGIRIGVIQLDDGLVAAHVATLASLPTQLSERWLAWSEIGLGWLETRRGDPGGVDRIQRARQKLSETGMRGYQPLFAAMAAAGSLAAGRYDDAGTLLDDGLTVMRETGECWCEAELQRLHGALRYARAARRARSSEQLLDEAQDCFGRALAIARDHGAKWWQLRAAVSLAHLLAERGRRSEARQLLHDEYGGFGDGLDLPDLRAAQALLASLG